MITHEFTALNDTECAEINGGDLTIVAGLVLVLCWVAKDVLDHYAEAKAALKQGYKDGMAT